jgi:hypothetical protein
VTEEDIYEPDFEQLAMVLDHDAAKLGEALEWVREAVQVESLAEAAQFRPFFFRNAERDTFRLELDWTGTTCSSILPGEPSRYHVVFDSPEGLAEFQAVLEEARKW